MKTTIACIAILLFAAAADASGHGSGLFNRVRERRANRQAMRSGCAGVSVGCHGATYVLPPVKLVIPPPRIVVPPPQVMYAPATIGACEPAERRRLFGRWR